MKTTFCSLLAAPALLLGLTSCYVTTAGGPYGAPPPGPHYGNSGGVVVLPRGAERVVYSGSTYYTHNDMWYRPSGSGYVVVSRPSGYRGPHGRGGHSHGNVVVLPRDARQISHRGTVYYVDRDTWYRPSGSGYVVVSRPSDYRAGPPGGGYRPGPRSPHSPGGVVVLPREARRVVHRGNTYYTHGNVWYRSSGSGYVVVSRPY